MSLILPVKPNNLQILFEIKTPKRFRELLYRKITFYTYIYIYIYIYI